MNFSPNSTTTYSFKLKRLGDDAFPVSPTILKFLILKLISHLFGIMDFIWEFGELCGFPPKLISVCYRPLKPIWGF